MKAAWLSALTVVWCVVKLHYINITPDLSWPRLLQFKKHPPKKTSHTRHVGPTASDRNWPIRGGLLTCDPPGTNGGRAGQPPVPACKLPFHSLQEFGTEWNEWWNKLKKKERKEKGHVDLVRSSAFWYVQVLFGNQSSQVKWSLPVRVDVENSDMMGAASWGVVLKVAQLHVKQRDTYWSK